MHVRDMRELFVPEQDKYLILDTQGGQEDILALVVALKLAQHYDRVVLGITCVAGRRKLEESVRDALIAQQIAGTKFPVYIGSSQSILLKKDYPKCINFSNDFSTLAEYALDQSLNHLVQKQTASCFIYESIKKYNNQLSFMSFGPLTNLALAFHYMQCSGRHYQLSTIRINGGSYDGVGNVFDYPSVEGNFYFDPEAAHIVVTNFLNIYVNPIERTLSTDLRRELQTITQNHTKSSPKILIDILHELLQHEYCTNGPLLTVLGAFDKLITDKVMNVYSEIIRTGYGLAGMMVPNWLRLDVAEGEQIPNTKIYRDINRNVLLKLLKSAFDE